MSDLTTLMLAQDSATALDTESPIFLLISLSLVVLMFAGMYAAFVKAGQPGWGAIVPIYNLYLMCKIADRPGWWVLLFLIPFVGLVVMIVVTWGIARTFDKGIGYTLGLTILPFVFWPMLGFGPAQHYLAHAPRGSGRASTYRPYARTPDSPLS